jgi:hypothetical protein
MRKPRIKPPELSFDQAQPVRLCAYPGCGREAEHKAPKGRQSMNEYHWFCTEHARIYNEAWDYYSGMSTEEIDQSRRDDGLWNRPTWPLGSGMARGKEQMASQDALFRQAFDAFHAFSETEAAAGKTFRWNEQEEFEKKEEHAEIRQAFATFGLNSTRDAEVIKQRYKELVKQYHPDSRGGDTTAEETLKKINFAYTVLKKHGIA